MSTQEVADITESTQIKLVSTHLISGATPKAIADELKTSVYFVRKMINSEEFKAYHKENSDNLVSLAANTLRGAMQDLVAESVRVLKYQLKANNLEAVKVVTRIAGVEKAESTPQQGNIQVILPDFRDSKEVTTIEVKDV